MKDNFVDIQSMTEVHRFYNLEKPRHPLITIIDLAQTKPDRSQQQPYYRTGFYNIMCKRFQGEMRYGKAYYDFDEGSLMFTAPNQVISAGIDLKVTEGWGLFFHPDLLNSTALGRKIHEYSFFNYEVSEALHISEDEKAILLDILQKIKKEYDQNVDKHTHSLITDNLQLLLNYCSRFYDRQFMTRAKPSNDIVQQFELLLKDYFTQDTLLQQGIPEVAFFASKLNLSTNYLSDLLNKFTGKTTQEHIHLQLVDKAKELLWGTGKSISEIAYELGFDYPSHFTKIFKNMVGKSPKAFRSN
jgi:AraC family transcriptional activator of pobA